MRILPLIVIGSLLLALAARAFTPADLPGLALWLRADAGTNLDTEARVDTWGDAERHNEFLQANPSCRPVIVPHALNGLPALRFDGKDSYLQLRNPIAVGDGAVFIVARWDAKCLDGSARYLLGNDSGTNGYLISDGRGRVLGSASTALYQNGARVLSGRIGVDPRIFPLANAPLSAFSIISVIGNTRPKELLKYIGQNGMNRSRDPFLGDVAEIIVVTQPITPAQQRAVEGYLGSKYFNWPLGLRVPTALTAGVARTVGANNVGGATVTRGLDHGVLFCGTGDAALPPGRYRLHFRLAMPTRDPALRVFARLDTATRTVTPADLSGEASTEFTLDYLRDALAPTELPHIRLAWTTNPDPDAPDPATMPLPRAQSTGTNAFDLSVHNLWIERCCPVAITAVTADKVRYEPDGRGQVRVTLRNFGGDVTGTLGAQVIYEVDDRQTILPPAPLTLKAGETVTRDIPFQATGYGGAGAQVTVVADGLQESAEEAFTVANNPFEAGLGVDFGSAVHTGLKRYPGAVARARRLYATWIDLPGWSPGECAQLVPDTPAWWSARRSAPETDAGVKELVALAHGQGMAVVAGVSLTPAGPPAWKLAAAHPEWFGKDAGQAAVPEAITGWNDPQWRKHHVHPGAQTLAADWTKPALASYVREQLRQSRARYGWDAFRLDDSTGMPDDTLCGLTAIPRVVPRDTSPVEGALVGHSVVSGLYLQEGLRFWQDGTTFYRSWNDYLAKERRAAAQVRTANGQYAGRLNTAFLPPATAYYKLVYSLLAEMHPADEVDAPGCPNWGAFLTRWSCMLWDPMLSDIDPACVQVTGGPFLRIVRERAIPPTRSCIVLHLVTPPASDTIADTAFPPRPGRTTVAYKPRPGTRVVRAVVVRPDATPSVTPLEPASPAVLPPLGYWAMVIWEIERTAPVKKR